MSYPQAKGQNTFSRKVFWGQNTFLKAGTFQNTFSRKVFCPKTPLFQQTAPLRTLRTLFLTKYF